ncbi:MFS family permease [Catenulispora sp. EB89]|uniref:MFS transporter n=1 Tax=Catenulispora sp. EB89 TaxID=3156257 RepID=UPI003514200D
MALTQKEPRESGTSGAQAVPPGTTSPRAALTEPVPPQAASSEAAPPEDAPAESGSVWRNHDFVKLWTGETISLIGTQITQFTLPLIAVLTLHASVSEVGLLNASRSAPVVAVILFAGVWVDRHRRRPILIGCALGCGVLIGLIPLASSLGVLSMGLMYVVCILTGVLSVVSEVGVFSYVPSLVERRHLAATNSRLQTSLSLAMVAGPGLAGVLVGTITAPTTLTADAISYFCCALGLIAIRGREPAPAAQHQSVRSSIAEGVRAVFGSPVLRGLLTQSGTFNLFQSGLITILVVYAIKDLLLTPFQLGVVLGAIAVGGVCGSMSANRIRERFGLGRTMAAGITAGTLCPLFLLIPRSSSFASLAILSTVEFVYGFGVLMFNVNATTLRQSVTPDRLLGRVNASYRLAVLGTLPIGAALSGFLGQAVGLRSAMVIIACLITTPILWVAFSPAYRLKTMPTEPLPELMGASIATGATSDGEH